LPAGPLRESFARLQNVDAIVINGRISEEINTSGWARIFDMKLSKDTFYNSMSPVNQASPVTFSAKHLHAVAVSDNAPWFFDQIYRLGLTAELRTFAEDHRLVQDDLHFSDNNAVLMTEEDAAKCQSFANDKLWILLIEAHVGTELTQSLIKKVKKIKEQVVHKTS
jgi:tetraacyldisaccharide 4'-kinase